MAGGRGHGQDDFPHCRHMIWPISVRLAVIHAAMHASAASRAAQLLRHGAAVLLPAAAIVASAYDTHPTASCDHSAAAAPALTTAAAGMRLTSPPASVLHEHRMGLPFEQRRGARLPGVDRAHLSFVGESLQARSGFASATQMMAEQPRLVETPRVGPGVGHTPTSTALKTLSFECAKCGELVVPSGSTEAISVRLTPEGESPVQTVASTPRVWQDSVFTSSLRDSGVTHGEVIPSSIFRSKGGPFTDACQRALLCAGCGIEVGYTMLDSSGALLSAVGRPPYKLVYYKDGRGFVLRLVDEAPWDAMKAAIPPAPSTPEHRHLEHSLEILKLPPDHPTAAERLHDLYSKQMADGRVMVRSSAPHEMIGGRGLVAADENPLSPMDPAAHVRNNSSATRVPSPYISATEDLSVGLLWTLPFGKLTVISPLLAERLEVTLIPNAELIALIEGIATNDTGVVLPAKTAAGGGGDTACSSIDGAPLAGDVAVDHSTTLLRAWRAKETLIRTGVGPAAVEEARSSILGIPVGPLFVLSGLERTGGNEWGGVDPLSKLRDGECCKDSRRLFPYSVEAFAELVAVPHPPGFSPSPDSAISVLAARADRTTPLYILVRMSRNALSDSTAPHAPLLALADALVEGRVQLRRAVAQFVREEGLGGGEEFPLGGAGAAAHPPSPPVAYYEVDVRLWQDRELLPALPGSVCGVPLLLLPWGCPGAQAAAERLYKLKKGGVK